MDDVDILFFTTVCRGRGVMMSPSKARDMMDLGTNAHILESTTTQCETGAFKEFWDASRYVDRISHMSVSSMPPPYLSLVFTLRG